MKWFEGDIPMAIKQAKDTNAIFIVYISGQDDISKEMEATWSDADVSSLCEENGCVALRLVANSDTCAQFSMIYPVVCVPSTFFIGDNGVPLEVTGGSVKPAEFVKKITQVLQLHKAQSEGKQVRPLGLNSSPQGAEPAVATTPEGAAPSSPGEEMAQTSTEMMETESEKSDEASAGTSKPLEDKIESRDLHSPRAKQLLAKKQAEKAEKEKEEQRKMELERRKIGQEVVRLKQWQQDQQMKEQIQEWKKEKEEQKREKERILRELARDRTGNDVEDSIQKENDPSAEDLKTLRAEMSARYHQADTEREKKQKKLENMKAEALKEAEAKTQRSHEQLKEQLLWDREEKKARYQMEREERDKAHEEQKQKKQKMEENARQQAEAAKMEHARLQFRLPDGSAVTNQFSSHDTLQLARNFLSEKIGNSLGNFQLTTTYPKRRFQDDDLPKTLLDLGLAPSAVIVVIPGTSRSVSKKDNGGLSSLLMTLLAPLLAIWNFLYALLFATPSEPRGVYNPVRPQTATSSSEQTTSRTSQGRERPKSSYGLRRRQEGNITRLSAVRDDDDDDTATWNGNSTQQM